MVYTITAIHWPQRMALSQHHSVKQHQSQHHIVSHYQVIIEMTWHYLSTTLSKDEAALSQHHNYPGSLRDDCAAPAPAQGQNQNTLATKVMPQCITSKATMHKVFLSQHGLTLIPSHDSAAKAVTCVTPLRS